METIVAKISEDSNDNNIIYEKATEVLKNGGLVAFPTETVYGLGGDALDINAAAKIYAAKGRPSDNPLIVHIANINDLYKLSSDVNDKAILLATQFWPGPLTMILKKSDLVPKQITGGLDTVAIRMPSHKVARTLIGKSGVYIAAPSANTSGKPSPTKAKHVIDDLSGKIDMIIQDGSVDIGIESTIIDLSEDVPTILRPGYITLAMLESVLGHVEVDKAIAGETVAKDVVPKAPGMKYRHYAPNAELTIVEGDTEAVVSKINYLSRQKETDGFKVGIMATDESKQRYKHGIVYSLGSRSDEAEVAKHLYDLLRTFDDCGVDYIYSEGFSSENVGQAVMNRLIKAAGHSIIKA